MYGSSSRSSGEGFSRLSPKAANVAFALIIVGFAACVTASYLELKLWEKY